MALHKETFAEIERECLPCRRTIKRWKLWLYDQFLVHLHGLRARFPELGSVQSIETFWHACFKQMSLAKAMFYVQQGAEVVP